MKPTIHTLLIMVGSFLVACSKESPNPDPNTYRVLVKENFTDPYKQLENIQVDDYVPYTITLTDSNNSSNGYYKLTSVKIGDMYNQTVGKDFIFSLTNNQQNTTNTETEQLIFSSKGTHNFYIRSLVSGTFKLFLELQKFVNEKPIGDAIRLKIEFSAVKINIFFHSQPNSNRYYCSLMIDDGLSLESSYLNSPNIIQSCQIFYLCDEEECSIKVPYKGKEVLTFWDSSNEATIDIKRLIITQSLINTTHYTSTIEYHNIKLQKSNYL